MSLTTHARLSATDFSCRLDPEFFSDENRKVRSRLPKDAPVVLDIADVSDGNHGSIAEAYRGSGYRYLRGTDLSSFFLDDSAPVFIAEDAFKRLGRGYVEPGDVLLTIVGTVGSVGIAPRWGGSMAANCKLAILRPRSIPPAVLAVFFTTDVGQAILRMETRGSVQQGIPLDGLKRMRLPVIPERVWRSVTLLVAEAEQIADHARRAYPEAETELLERVGWVKAAISEEATFEESISATAKAGRIDAEYFHPRQLSLARRLRRAGARTIGDVSLSNSKGVQPEYDEKGAVVVVKSKDVLGGTVALNNCSRANDAVWDENPHARLQHRDLLINATGLGTLGRAAVVPPLEKVKSIASVDITIWRLDPAQVLPEYASLFLNSPLGQMQAARYQTGSSGQLHLYPDHIRRFLLFVPTNRNGRPDISWQMRLEDKVSRGLRMRADALQRLTAARRLLTEALG